MIDATVALLNEKGFPGDLSYLFLFPYGAFLDGGYVAKADGGPLFCQIAATLGEPAPDGCEDADLAP
jgi:hypothetical protein